jgi:hypothetical protein
VTVVFWRKSQFLNRRNFQILDLVNTSCVIKALNCVVEKTAITNWDIKSSLIMNLGLHLFESNSDIVNFWMFSVLFFMGLLVFGETGQVQE